MAASEAINQAGGGRTHVGVSLQICMSHVVEIAAVWGNHQSSLRHG